MRVTVIPSDRAIGIDGQFLFLDYTADSNIHAIQWYDDHGEMEFEDHRPNRKLTENDYTAEVKPYVDAYGEALEALEAESAEESIITE